jgi:hypothetical protein
MTLIRTSKGAKLKVSARLRKRVLVDDSYVAFRRDVSAWNADMQGRAKLEGSARQISFSYILQIGVAAVVLFTIIRSHG